jgi:hypothetical protein
MPRDGIGKEEPMIKATHIAAIGRFPIPDLPAFIATII